MTLRRLAVLMIPAVLAAAACTSETDGEPSTAAQPTSAPTSSAPSNTGTELARTRTFDLATVDPCVLLTSDQLAEIGVDQPVTPSGEAGVDPTCNFLSSTGASYAVFLDLTSSASDTVGSAASAVASTVQIDGFDVPLISVPDQGCSAFVNTGDDQYLSVQANGIGQIPDDELCQLVQPATQMVLENLTALQP